MSVLDRLKAWRLHRREEGYRAAHRRGHDCRFCGIHVSSRGAVSRPLWSYMRYCPFDVPELRGRKRPLLRELETIGEHIRTHGSYVVPL